MPATSNEAELFASLARPSGTVTGFSNYGEELSAKRLEIVRELLPSVQKIGVLHTLNDPVFRDWGEQTGLPLNDRRGYCPMLGQILLGNALGWLKVHTCE